MELFALTYCIDLMAFGFITLAMMVLVQRWVSRSAHARGFTWRAWTTLSLVMAVAILLALFSGSRERARIERTVSGLAPTYAEELRRMGHDRIALDTAADDPTYLNLIDAEIRWLKTNPAVADIYTFGKRPDGTVVLLVDSETDYDRNGAIDEDREKRTAIGEPYTEDGEAIARAFAGEDFFSSIPFSDPWGTWVSSYVPMKDDRGRVVAVMGIDFPAGEWVHSILSHRVAVLGLGEMVAVIFIASLTITTTLRAEVARRRETESALRASECRLRTIVDNEPECVMVVDKGGLLLEINPAGLRILEATAAEVLGKPLWPLVSDAHQPSWRRHHDAVFGGAGGMAEFEFTGLHGGRRRVWMETHSVPLRDSGGDVVSVLSVARDVSVRKQAEAEREMLHKQLMSASRHAGMAEIATGVLHNVGNVLNSVNVSADAICEKLKGRDVAELADAASMIRGHAGDLSGFLASDTGRHFPEYVAALAECLKDNNSAIQNEMTRLTRGIDHIKEIVRTQQEFSRESVMVTALRPVQLFEDALSMSRLSLERHNIEVVREFEELPPLCMDGHKVMQILINLIGNARQAVKEMRRESGTITLRMSFDRVQSRVKWEVEDDGIGIPPDIIARVFQHGFTTRANGHGFGLHSSATTAIELGGALLAHSDGPGLGAKFTLTIPVAIPEESVR